MKKHWNRLWEIAFKKAGEVGVNYDNKQYVRAWSIYNHMFLKHHQHADEIVVSFDGTPLEARYKCGDMRDKIQTDWDKQKELLQIGETQGND